MKKLLLSISLVITMFYVKAQNYTSYFTGDTSDVNTPTVGVSVIMGGATEHDSAMVWFLQHSGGGDVVVLRTSGSNGYNDYMYSQLGVSVNSVETIVCNNASASNDPYVIHQLMNAEALWFAGGDQWTYVSYWNNTPLDTIFNYLINVKKIPVGGTSAGMAILSHIVNTAENGSATSAASLANPYVSNITLQKDEFIFTPWLNNVVTDTVKICDMGEAKKMTREFTKFSRKEGFGTEPYLAPEVLNGKEYGFKADIWAIGIIFHKMLTKGGHPFNPNNEKNAIKEKVLGNEREISKNIKNPLFLTILEGFFVNFTRILSRF